MIKALEQALNVRATPEIVLLRKIMECGQIIHSHMAHVFFFSLPDLSGDDNNFDLVKKYPRQAEYALAVRHFGVEVCRVIGGRSVHPINSVVGGFNVEPDFGELKYTIEHADEMMKRISGLLGFLWKFSIPKFERPTNYISLKRKGDYAIYDGKIYFSDSRVYDTAEGFLRDVRELTQPHERVKRVEHLGQPFMVGALARLNNNFDELQPAARAAWRKLKLKLPCYNSFVNIFAQIIEIIHCLEEIKSLFERYARQRARRGFESRLKVPFKPNPGKGIGIMEAPRGLLYHEYELDKEGNILAERNIMSNSPDMGKFGEFKVVINYAEPKTEEGYAEAFDYSAKDGSMENLDSSAVKFKTVESQIIKAFYSNTKIDPSARYCNKTYAVERRVAKTDGPARVALEEMLIGPTNAEIKNGYFSSIAQLPEIEIQKLTIENGLAKVDFNEALNQQGGGSCKVAAIRSQIENTLKQFSTVKKVEISVDGNVGEALQP